MSQPSVPRIQLQVERAGAAEKQLWNNRYLLGAFVLGVVLLGSVLLIPALEPLFEVAALSAPLVGAIVGLAFGSMLVIQLLKAIRTALQKK